ncbi:MAG: hypothetical protein UY63_C0018G0028 [Parcubacteria group bacterium GW2011_GWA2_51_10]|nr:MAG: hypothetical protein UY63_C0018G0028 [Parcubacteria group bacterium GW2011_GWA2_51_10]
MFAEYTLVWIIVSVAATFASTLALFRPAINRFVEFETQQLDAAASQLTNTDDAHALIVKCRHLRLYARCMADERWEKFEKDMKSVLEKAYRVIAADLLRQITKYQQDIIAAVGRSIFKDAAQTELDDDYCGPVLDQTLRIRWAVSEFKDAVRKSGWATPLRLPAFLGVELADFAPG